MGTDVLSLSYTYFFDNYFMLKYSLGGEIALLEVGRCLISDRLRERHMTQQELADLSGISKSQISDYISKRVIMSLKNAKRIAIVLKCHIDDLYEWKRSGGM